MRALFVPILTLAAFGFVFPGVAANHTQTESGRAVVFDHRLGNEWWVEVILSGQDADAVARVEGMDTGGPWHGLHKNQWGVWVAGFHIEPGHLVRFRAFWEGGPEITSCWFTHPAGTEQCGGTGGFNASFTGVRGNEWWIQANVGSSGPALDRVDVTLDRGVTWQPLEKKWWGAWAASYHIADGTIVRLRAISTDGQTDLSNCRRWIPPSGQDAQIVSCTSSVFDATFTGVKGNNWWVQVNVAANQPITGVFARVDCRTDWEPLVKQSWGGWARSFFIPTGAKVDFQARTTTHASDVSGGYTWTQATPTTGCPYGDWPRQGSYVTYYLSSGVCGGGNCENTEARMHLVYDQGRWMGTCTARDTFDGADGSHTTRDWASDHVGLAPSWLTPRTQVGAEHRPDMFNARFGDTSCSMGWTSSPLYVVRQETVQVEHESGGGSEAVLVWYAESRNETDNFYTARWDAQSGLVVDITSHPRRSQQGGSFMSVIDTNAPIG